MKTRLAAFLAPIALASIVPAPMVLAGEVAVQGSGMSRDLACENGQGVVIAGADHKIVLSGRCGAVKVMGTGHALSFETAESLVVSGADNVVEGGTTGSLVVKVTNNRVTAAVGPSGSGQITVSGADQKLELALGGPTQLTVKGSGNVVTWTAQHGVKPPSVSASGFDNRISRR